MRWVAVVAEILLLVNLVVVIVAVAEPVRHWWRENIRIVPKDEL